MTAVPVPPAVRRPTGRPTTWLHQLCRTVISKRVITLTDGALPCHGTPESCGDSSQCVVRLASRKIGAPSRGAGAGAGAGSVSPFQLRRFSAFSDASRRFSAFLGVACSGPARSDARPVIDHQWWWGWCYRWLVHKWAITPRCVTHKMVHSARTHGVTVAVPEPTVHSPITHSPQSPSWVHPEPTDL